MTSLLKDKAVALRKHGHSYSYISQELKVPKSTLSYWLRQVPYMPNKTTRERIKMAIIKSVNTRLEEKRIELEKIKSRSRKKIGNISQRDLFLTGIGLYWGEGRKFDESVTISNSDPKMIRFYIHWLNVCCGVPLKDLKGEIHLYPDSNIKIAKRYWGKVTGLKEHQFYKTQIDKRLGKKKAKKGRLPYGTIHIYMKAGNVSVRKLHRMIVEWINQVAGVAQR